MGGEFEKREFSVSRREFLVAIASLGTGLLPQPAAAAPVVAGDFDGTARSALSTLCSRLICNGPKTASSPYSPSHNLLW